MPNVHGIIISVLVFAFPDGTIMWLKEEGTDVNKIMVEWQRSLSVKDTDRFKGSDVSANVSRVRMFETDFLRTQPRIHLMN